MKLHELLKPDLIQLDISAADRAQVITQLVSSLERGGYIAEAATVAESVIKREEEVGTGIGYGVAIPHADPGLYKAPLLAFGRLKKGIDFHAPDKVPARLIFLLLTSEATPALHVRLLARICRLLKSDRLRNQLLEAGDPDQIVAAVAAAEGDYPDLTP